MARRSSSPPGLTFARRFTKSNFSFNTYRVLVLAVTFLTYALYHEARKPASIVKSVLDPEGEAELGLNAFSHSSWSNYVGYSFRWEARNESLQHGRMLEAAPQPAVAAVRSTGDRPGWAPFNTPDGKVKLGEIDLGFLACYAVGMYFSGHIGDRTDIRLFLTAGMMGSGLFVCLFGVGYWLDIHSFSFYLLMQMLAGVLQSTGWPSVVSVMANWFGKGQRGFIMGVWNAHTSVGNIAGSLISSAVLKYGWGWAFVVSGLLMVVGGVIVFLFLAVRPEDVGHTSPSEAEEDEAEAEAEAPVGQADVVGAAFDDATADALEKGRTTTEEEAGLLRHPKDADVEEMRAVSFLEAWTIPGVAPYAFCLFFAKLVAYTFMDWLPFYIRSTEIGGRYLNGQDSGNLSTMYDVGGVVGGILAGFISDRMKGRAVTAASFMYLAIPALFMFRSYGYISIYVNIALMLVMGMCINGPYALITTAVSADLGTHESLKGNARALSTVTAIIDGTGSVGAAMGPLLTGFISQWGWDSVFYMLMFSALVSGLLLTRLVIAELLERFRTVSIMQDDLTEL